MFFRRKKPEQPSFEQLLDDARRAGFTVEPAGDGVRLTKYGCSAVISRDLRFLEKPGVLVNGHVTRLIDRGYQKFLQTPDGRSRPALASQLQARYRFDTEMRHIFRLTTLYNEALGTVSDRYVYDRLEGRP